MKTSVHIYVGKDAISKLVNFCRDLPEQNLTLVMDNNTYVALGQRVKAALQKEMRQVTAIVLEGEEVVADEKYLMQVFLQAPRNAQVFLAVGSGTITDITRYVSYRTGNRFISVPSAPSVDGFISPGAPLIVRGMKNTYLTQPPFAVFADLETLAAAPKELIAAGYGDIIGKFTALADWKLAHLIWDEPFDFAVEARVRHALQKCIAATDEIAAGLPEGIQFLIEALLESGLGMLEFGNSRPASGSEHHCSHYWEMKLLEEGKPAILHGAKVGYATMLIARQYAKLREISLARLADILEKAHWQSYDEQIAEIEHVYPSVAKDIIAAQQLYLHLSLEDLTATKQRIVDRWASIQDVLALVPPPDEIEQLLQCVGAPVNWQTLGLEEARALEAVQLGHYLRKQFTVMKLVKLLGISLN